MAVTGRTKSHLYFSRQAAMLESSIALPSAKNSLVSVSRLWPRFRERAWANTAVWPGGNSVRGPSAQYSALAFLTSSRLLVSARAVSMSVGLQQVPSGFLGGPGTLYWIADSDANGGMLAHCGVSGRWMVSFGGAQLLPGAGV